jgi:hypothetical protein
MMVFTWSPVVMEPTHLTAIPTSLRIISAPGSWNMRP